MDSVKTARALAAATLIAWTVKSLVIWQAGGLDKSDFEGPLFILGFLLLLATWTAIGFAASRGRAVWMRLLAAIVGFVIGVVLMQALDALSGAVVPNWDGWFQEEAGLLATALITVLVAFGWLGRRATTPAADA